MFVPQEIKDRVNAKLQEGLDIAQQKYGRKFPFPTVTYDVRGTRAGVAYYTAYKVGFNPVLLMENLDEFIQSTVPHELAHLLTYNLFPEAFITFGRKREHHGYHWQTVMIALGADPKRCHEFDVTNTRVKKSTSRQIKWKCSHCNTELLLTPQKSDKLRAYPDSLWHRGCRGARLIEVKDVKTVAPVATPVQPTTATPPAGGSKMDQCSDIYLKHRSTHTRGQIITMFCTLALCTPAGANTYYATLKKRHG